MAILKESNMSEMLNNVIIVAARISGLSNERELERTERDGVMRRKATRFSR